MFKSKLFWGGVLLCGVAILFGILIHNANQPQETITIYGHSVVKPNALALGYKTANTLISPRKI